MEKVVDRPLPPPFFSLRDTPDNIFFYLFIKFDLIDINEFMRGFILTTQGDLQSKIDYTFRIYDQNNDNQISGEEIKKMANVI